MSNFISLHNHSSFSLLKSLVDPKEYFIRAKELNQPAIAITDIGTLAGSWEAFKSSKELGVKLIIGSELYFLDDAKNKEGKFRDVVLLAKNHRGYKNLLAITREGFDNAAMVSKKVMPVIDWSLLEKYSNGLICLTGGGNGIIGQLINKKEFDKAEETIQKLTNLFKDDLYLEVQTHYLNSGANYYSEAVNQIFTNTHIIRLGNKLGVKIIPTNNSFYLKKEDAEVNDVLLAIGAMQPVYSNARLKFNTNELYLKSYQEVKDFFSRNYGEEFTEKLCLNTLEVNEKCEVPEWIDPKYSNKSGKELPVFPIQQEEDYKDFLNWCKKQSEYVRNLPADQAFLRFRCGKAFLTMVPRGKEEIYRERLNEELDVMEFRGFSSYMLIVADMLKWARKNGLRTGLGRGGCGGCLIAYLLNIHYADPIKYDLIFARFHNKFKVSMPDIDNDIVSAGRGDMINYIRRKYGDDKFALVSNLNSLTPKVFVRDVARSCEIGGNRLEAVRIGNDVADIIPKRVDEKDIKTFQEAKIVSPLFEEYIKKYPEFEKYKDICGVYRNFSVHAGGIIITDRPMKDFVPTRVDKDGLTVVEMSKNDAEDLGLVKIDLLGVSTLDIVGYTYQLIKEQGKELPPDPPNFDEYDKKTYDLISRGDTLCVFQLGTSSGTMDLCRKIQPKTLEDISYINSLARPSARDIRDPFIAVRNGKKKMSLMHPVLKRSFGSTFGFGLYEESLLFLAQDVAGWSLHEADSLRKMTKAKGKMGNETIKLREKFITDSKNKGIVSEEQAIRIWDDVIVKFGAYGFNHSHSIFYSMLAYHTAYLKAHYPLEFLLANLVHENNSNAANAEDTIAKIKQEIRKLGVKIDPPDINKSEMDYKIQPDGSLLTGLDCLKFMNTDAIEEIIKNRPYNSFDEFVNKNNTKKLRLGAIQALAASGALRSFGLNRKSIFSYAADYKKKFQQWNKKHNPAEFQYEWVPENEWSPKDVFAYEKHYLGEVYSSNKKDAYVGFFDKQYTPIKQILSKINKEKVDMVRGTITSVFEFKVKKENSKYFGQSMIKAGLEDHFGDQITLTIFPDRLTDFKKWLNKGIRGKLVLEEGLALAFSGTVNIYEGNTGIVFENIIDVMAEPKIPKKIQNKKVQSKKYSDDKEINNVDVNDTEKMEGIIEDQLVNEGLIDLEDEDQIDLF